MAFFTGNALAGYSSTPSAIAQNCSCSFFAALAVKAGRWKLQ